MGEYLQKDRQADIMKVEAKNIRRKFESQFLDRSLSTEMPDFFTGENLEMHNTPEQIERQENLSGLTVSNIDNMSQTGTVKEIVTGENNERVEKQYKVSLQSCTCEDFQERHLPCKHIYKLASSISLPQYRNEYSRSEKLIADFSKGYAEGWRFIVRPCNYAALDIQETMRVVGGEKKSIYTQGVAYNFTRGSVFYDTVKAYELEWSEALKVINNMIQIDYTTPSTRTGKVVYYDDNFLEHYFSYIASADYGLVEFTLYKPNSDRTKLEKFKSYSCRQDEFVNLLKTGEFADVNGEVQKI